VCLSICLSVRPGPKTHILKKTHTFSFQVSRNEGPVCLGTWGKGRVGAGAVVGACQGDQGRGRAGQGRALKRVAKAGQGRGSLSICLTNRGRVGQGKALFSVTLGFADRPSDDRVQIITVFTNCH